MPITKSAKKALRQNKRKELRNINQKRQLKKLLKEMKKLIEQKKTAEAKKILPKVYKLLDKSAKTGLIKKNKASRKKSRVTKALAKSDFFKTLNPNPFPLFSCLLR